MNVAECLTLLNWIKFPCCPFPWTVVCPFPVHPACAIRPRDSPPHGGRGALNSCWPRMCFPSTSENWEEPWVVNPGSGTAQRSLFALTQTTAGTPAWGDAAWWGRVSVWVCPSSPHSGVQGPRLQVSGLEHTAHALWVSAGKTTSSLRVFSLQQPYG